MTQFPLGLTLELCKASAKKKKRAVSDVKIIYNNDNNKYLRSSLLALISILNISILHILIKPYNHPKGSHLL